MSKQDPVGWITTYSGVKFNPFKPVAKDVDIVDIAQATSNLCRFTGHVKKFYSVAEHCILVSQLVPEEHALAALLHDASEAYVNDMPAPMKRRPELALYLEVELGVQRAVYYAFDVPFPYPDCVKEVDYNICAAEAKKLFKDVPDWALERDAPNVKFMFYPPDEARKAFLARFNELMKGRKK